MGSGPVCGQSHAAGTRRAAVHLYRSFRAASRPHVGREVGSMREPAATAIVRCMNEERTIEKTLAVLRRQTVTPEIIVVDSGSSDSSGELARPLCDRVNEIPPQQLTYCRTPHIGARAAAARLH